MLLSSPCAPLLGLLSLGTRTALPSFAQVQSRHVNSRHVKSNPVKVQLVAILDCCRVAAAANPAGPCCPWLHPELEMPPSMWR